MPKRIQTRGKTKRAWRMAQKCADCPFASQGAGLHLRLSLGKGRWREITSGLLRGEHFLCHKTTGETGDGTNLVCAGAIEFQDRHEVSSNYVRICERLEYFRQQRES